MFHYTLYRCFHWPSNQPSWHFILSQQEFTRRIFMPVHAGVWGLQYIRSLKYILVLLGFVLSWQYYRVFYAVYNSPTCSWQGLYSLSRKASYRKISWSLEVARFRFRLFQLLWNLTGTSAATLPRCLSNFNAKQSLQHSISRLRDFMRFGGKTSYRLVNRGPGRHGQICCNCHVHIAITCDSYDTKHYSAYAGIVFNLCC